MRIINFFVFKLCANFHLFLTNRKIVAEANADKALSLSIDSNHGVSIRFLGRQSSGPRCSGISVPERTRVPIYLQHLIPCRIAQSQMPPVPKCQQTQRETCQQGEPGKPYGCPPQCFTQDFDGCADQCGRGVDFLL